MQDVIDRAVIALVCKNNLSCIHLLALRNANEMFDVNSLTIIYTAIYLDLFKEKR
jgi:hypothetical protein